MKATIKFLPSSEHNKHFRDLRRRVKLRVKCLPQQRTNSKKYVALVLIGFYISFYLFAIHNLGNITIFFALYGALGLVSVLIFINIIHDAVHNGVFKKKWLNKAITYVFDIIGGNSFIWKKRHMLLHHNYQNIVGWDSDIEQAGLIKIFPQDEPNPVNRNQHWLIFFLYPLYLVNWILIRDFKDFFMKERTIKKVCDIPTVEYFKLFAFKLCFLFYTIGVPLVKGVSFFTVIMAFLIMLCVGSVFALIFLLTPHANESNQFPKPDQLGLLGTTWLEHQFITTNDIKLNYWLVRYFMGNFNFHLAHHLFPNISSVYAPEITLEIKNYAREFNFRYKSYSLIDALKLHYRLIKTNAFSANLFEEDM